MCLLNECGSQTNIWRWKRTLRKPNFSGKESRSKGAPIYDIRGSFIHLCTGSGMAGNPSSLGFLA